MTPIIGLIAQGKMGAGIGRRLVDRGLQVKTVLEGRSEASAQRAAKAGMVAATWDDMAQVDIFLSVLPPGEAQALASRLVPVLKAAKKKPVYADLNAVSPATVEKIAATIAPTGCVFADGSILGGPPGATGKGPAIFASGPGAKAIGELNRFGLDIRVMDAPVGAASTVKMSFAGITKGYVAMCSMMILAASRAGVADVVRAELSVDAPGLLARLDEALPNIYERAYRFGPEMTEIAEFLVADPTAAQVYEGFAKFYARIAADLAGDKKEVNTLRAFTAMGSASKAAE